MRPAPVALLLGALALTGCQAPPAVAPSHAEIVREQLALLLADQMPACGTVSQYRRQDRLDYRVECSSGQAFRVQVAADGQVLITVLAR